MPMMRVWAGTKTLRSASSWMGASVGDEPLLASLLVFAVVEHVAYLRPP